MTSSDWRRLIDEAAELGARELQFIGGEPTIHPGLPDLVRHALRRHLSVEIYSNLARPLSEEPWRLFALPGVRLATSYYASDARIHEAITDGPANSHRKTRANIVKALQRSIELRVGVVEVHGGQDIERVRGELVALGVQRIDVDRRRRVGRGADGREPSVDELCGACTDGVLAVSPNGDAWPCVFARWLVLGNVREVGLATILERAVPVREELLAAFRLRANNTCPPKKIGPPCPPNFQKDPPKCPPQDGAGERPGDPRPPRPSGTSDRGHRP